MQWRIKRWSSNCLFIKLVNNYIKITIPFQRFLPYRSTSTLTISSNYYHVNNRERFIITKSYIALLNNNIINKS